MVLTCAHVLRLEKIGSEEIVIEWDGRTFTGVLRDIVPSPCPPENIFPDLAIVNVLKPGSIDSMTDHPCVLLDEHYEVGDHLYAFGFSRGRPGGDSMMGDCEGESQYGRSSNERLIKIKGTQVRPGASGAPVLNLNTGKVCGMMKRTRDEVSSLGGFAVRIATVFQHFPQLREANSDYHRAHPDWLRALSYTGSSRESLAPLTPPMEFAGPSSVQSLLDALPVTARKLFGRQEDLAWLDNCLADQHVSIAVLYAFGGVGKTAIVRNWIESRFRSDNARDYVFVGCSFYSQGTRERAGTSDQFFYDSLSQLGDPEPTKGTLWARAKRLAKLLSERDSIVILDGLEPLQYGPGQTDIEGRLKDIGIRELLSTIAQHKQRTFCVITTRLPLSEPFSVSGLAQRSLELLPVPAAEELLRSRGVRGTAEDLRDIANHFGRHSLALVLAAEYLTTYCDADASRARDIPLLNEETKAGRHAKSVMEAYEIAFRRESNFTDLELLYLLGLFDRPAKWAWLKILCTSALPGFQHLGMLDEKALIGSLERLSRLGLLSNTYLDGKLDTHPLIAEYFGRKFQLTNPAGWCEANNRLFRFLADSSATDPVGLEELEPLFLAVVHGCKAGLHSEALNEVFIPRIMKHDEAYATIRLGLVGPVLTVLSSFFKNRDWTDPWLKSDISPSGLNMEEYLYVLTQVGFLLTALKGYATPELRTVYDIALVAAAKVDAPDALFQIKYGLWRFHSGRGDLSVSIQRGIELTELACLRGNKMYKVVAHRALATSYYRTAQFSKALTEAQAGIGEFEGRFPAYLGDDPSINCECFASLAHWHLGDIDESLNLQSAAIRHATERADSHGMAVALYLAAYLFDFTGKYQEALEHSVRMIEISSEHGFRWWLAAGMIRRGWASAMLGNLTSGLDELERGIALWEASGATIGLPYWKSLRAIVQRSAGEHSLALESLQEAIVSMNETGERWWEPELYRQSAELLLDDGVREDEAVNLFRRAINVARSHGDRSLESRACNSLASYLRAIGNDTAATEVFAGRTDSCKCPEVEMQRNHAHISLDVIDSDDNSRTAPESSEGEHSK